LENSHYCARDAESGVLLVTSGRLFERRAGRTITRLITPFQGGSIRVTQCVAYTKLRS